MTPEAELIERCRGGEQEAFRLLFAAHYERVYRTAYAVTVDPAAADEVVQDTFVKAWHGLARFRGDSSLATWLTRLAVNAARDSLRRRRTRGLLRPVLYEAWRPSGDPFQRVEQLDELQRAVHRLPPHLREVVALRYGLELSGQDMAQVLGCPEGTVKSRLNAALSKLRAMLQDDPVQVRVSADGPARPREVANDAG